MDWTQSAGSANHGSSAARLDGGVSADETARAPLARFDPDGHARAQCDAAAMPVGHASARAGCGASAGEHALAREDATGAALARAGCGASAGEHALAPEDATGAALARADCGPSDRQHALARMGATGAALARAGCGAAAGEHALAREDADGSARPAEFARARLEPQRYKVQFEASEEYVELVEKAKALLSHSTPRPDLGDLHLRALRALVAELERKKYAVTTRQRVARGSAAETADEQLAKGESESESESKSHYPRRRGRHIPAAIRRAVFERDAGRCTYRSDSGERCRETACLELHHSMAFARGGEHRLDNVALRCRTHNALAAEEDFGRDFVTSAIDSSQHELWARHEGPCALPPERSKAKVSACERWQVEREVGLGMQQIR